MKRIRTILKTFIRSQIDRRKLASQTLENHRINSLSMSQAGQDLWVYGEVFNEHTNGFFLDIGAHDGVHLSNTYLLETRYQWDGICIEANPGTFNFLKKNRKCKCLNKCIDNVKRTVDFAAKDVMGGIVSEDCDNNSNQSTEYKMISMDTEKLVDLLNKESAPKVIDYLSIDIEGAEDRALLEFPFEEYQFHCITIERPSTALQKKIDAYGYIKIKEIPDLDCFYLHESFQKEYMKNMFRFGAKKFLYRAIE